MGRFATAGAALAVVWMVGLDAPLSSRQSAIDPLPSAGDLPPRTVVLDAVVTDRRGNPVQNLRPIDFEVIENGVVQQLDSVEMRIVTPAVNSDNAVHAAIELDADEARAAREPGTRVVALLLDEFHVSAASTAHVRSALTQFVDDLRPQDLLAVLKPLDPLTAIRFTRDRDAARRAIETFVGRKGDYTALSEFEQHYLGRAPAAVQSGRAQIVMAALRALTMKLGDLDAGRAALVFVSEGLALGHADASASGTRREAGRRVPELQGIVRAASRFRVCVYALDPTGDVTRAGGNGSGSAEESRAAAMLRALASETGGEAVLGVGHLTAGLRRVVRDLDGYYLLTYTSSHSADGRYYDVRVDVKRRDAQVRARAGYWAPLRTELPGAAGVPTASARLERVIRRSPLIETWVGLTVASDGSPRMVFTWDGTNAPAMGRSQQPAIVALTASTERGAPLFEGEIAAAGVRTDGSAADRAVFHVPAGRIQLDLRILAADGTQLDLAGTDVKVPEFADADPLILPPQVFRTSSAREFREISGDPAAAPTPAREFRRTARLLLRVQTHSASGAAVQLGVRVMNRRGQVLRGIPPMVPASSHEPAQFDLPLSWLAPGEYTIELAATSPKSTTREIVRIRVTS